MSAASGGMLDDMRRGWLVLLVTAVGCSGAPDEASPERVRGVTRAAAQELTQVVAGAEGSPVARARGAFTSCGGGPDPRVTYRAESVVRARGDRAAIVDRAAEALADDGWTIDSQDGGDRPRVTASRDALAATVETPKFDDDEVVLVAVQHGCVADDEDANRDFDSEPLDVGQVRDTPTQGDTPRSRVPG